MSISGQELVANPALTYPGNGNVDFIAYYPYAATVESDYSIAVNIADQTAALPIEILYSDNVTNQEATELYNLKTNVAVIYLQSLTGCQKKIIVIFMFFVYLLREMSSRIIKHQESKSKKYILP